MRVLAFYLDFGFVPYECNVNIFCVFVCIMIFLGCPFSFVVVFRWLDYVLLPPC